MVLERSQSLSTGSTFAFHQGKINSQTFAHFILDSITWINHLLRRDRIPGHSTKPDVFFTIRAGGESDGE